MIYCFYILNVIAKKRHIDDRCMSLSFPSAPTLVWYSWMIQVLWFWDLSLLWLSIGSLIPYVELFVLEKFLFPWNVPNWSSRLTQNSILRTGLWTARTTTLSWKHGDHAILSWLTGRSHQNYWNSLFEEKFFDWTYPRGSWWNLMKLWWPTSMVWMKGVITVVPNRLPNHGERRCMDVAC